MATSSEPTTWLQDTFGKDLYLVLEILVPHRTFLVERLDQALPSDVKDSIKDAASDWDAMNILLRNLSDPLLQEAMQKAVAELPDLGSQLQVLRSGDYSNGRRPVVRFGRPPICVGRAPMIDELVGLLTEQPDDADDRGPQSALLHGIGGIGKSTVALEVLHDSRVASHFGERRFVVECEQVSTLDDLLGRLAIQLGVDTKGREIGFAVKDLIQSERTLLLLDNVDALCPHDGPASGVEAFLTSLVEEDDAVNLVIIKRDSATLHVPRLHAIPVSALSSEAVTDAFVHYTSGHTEIRSDPDLPALVERVDGCPLAVMLLGHLLGSIAGLTVGRLLQSYDIKRHEILDRDASNNSLTSLKICVELALDSPAISATGAQDLCFLLSLLPDGADHDIVETFLAKWGVYDPAQGQDQWSVVEAKRSLAVAGLVAPTPQGLLRMSAPLREYFVSKADKEGRVYSHSANAVQHRMLALVEAAAALNQPFSPQVVIARARVDGQLGNLSKALADGLSSNDPARVEETLHQSARLADVISATHPFVPSFLVRAAGQARTSGLSKLEAECVVLLGEIERALSHRPAALHHFKRAFDLETELGDSRSMISALEHLVDTARGSHNFAEARQYLEEALQLADAATFLDLKAYALRRLAEDALRQGNASDALSGLQIASALCRDLHMVSDEAKTLDLLGDSALMLADWIAARSHYENALRLFRDLEDHQGEASCLGSLGQLSMLQEDYSAAKLHLSEALRLYKEASDERGEALSLEQLGSAEYLGNEHQLARSHLEEALRLHRAAGDRLRQASIAHNLAGLSIEQLDLAAGVNYLNEVRRIWEEVGDRASTQRSLASVGHLIQQKGRSFLEEGRLTEAQSCLEIAIGLGRDVEDRKMEALTLGYLALCTLKQGDLTAGITHFKASQRLLEQLGDFEDGAKLFNDVMHHGAAHFSQEELHQRIFSGESSASDATPRPNAAIPGQGVGSSESLPTATFEGPPTNTMLAPAPPLRLREKPPPTARPLPNALAAPIAAAGTTVPPPPTPGTPSMHGPMHLVPTGSLLPLLEPLTFRQANLPAIRSKIDHFNAAAGADSLSVADRATLGAVIDFLQNPTGEIPTGVVSLLKKMLEWPESKRFAALDLLRLLALHSLPADLVPEVVSALAACDGTSSNEVRVNGRLAARAVANGLAAADAHGGLAEEATNIVEALDGAMFGLGPEGRVAAATVCFNYSILLNNGKLASDSTKALTTVVTKLVDDERPETAYRALVALGNILLCQFGKALSSADLQGAQTKAQDVTTRLRQPRIKEAAGEILAMKPSFGMRTSSARPLSVVPTVAPEVSALGRPGDAQSATRSFEPPSHLRSIGMPRRQAPLASSSQGRNAVEARVNGAAKGKGHPAGCPCGSHASLTPPPRPHRGDPSSFVSLLARLRARVGVATLRRFWVWTRNVHVSPIVVALATIAAMEAYRRGQFKRLLDRLRPRSGR